MSEVEWKERNPVSRDFTQFRLNFVDLFKNYIDGIWTDFKTILYFGHAHDKIGKFW